jgi:formylmethanofuran--tetrahydromethanopterin N-formyltransferase
MEINGVAIDDTYAEAFGMKATRLIITAANMKWAIHAARSLTGFATSVIGCGCEAGIERGVPAEESPDGRPGIAVLLFAVSGKELARQVEKRVGQCVLTSPTSALYAGLEGDPVNLGKNLRYFGDGFQISKVIGGRRYWRIPVMDGEFLCEEQTGMVRAIGGGNFIIQARGQDEGLAAAEAAVEAIADIPGVILPFPGGVVRSGSKVGSKYKALPASTNDAYCPTLRGAVRSELSADAGTVLEIVIDGLTEPDIRAAMKSGIAAACSAGRRGSVLRIGAGNYGGKLGQFHFHLHDLMQ